jgi:N-methylhydantoinase B
MATHYCEIFVALPKTWLVKLSPGGEVDETATLALRAKLAEARVRMRIIADDAVKSYAGLKGRHRIVRIAATDAARLEVADDTLVEMFGRHPAPLRAWVRVEGGEHGTIRMDRFGRNVLGASDADQIYIRRISTSIVPKGLAGSVR